MRSSRSRTNRTRRSPSAAPAARASAARAPMNIDGTNTLACLKSCDEVKGDVPHLSAAAHAGGEGPRARSHALLCPAPLDRAVAEDHDAGAPDRVEASHPTTAPSSMDSTSAFSAPAARRLVPRTGGTATATWGRQRFCRPIAGLLIRAMKRPASGSTMSRIRSGSTAATRS